MAEGQQVSSLPLPPMQYVNLYTDENIKRGRAPKPPPPIKDTYHMFGHKYNADEQIILPLETQGLKRLYPTNYDHKRELKKLNHSILTNFLDLLDILIKSPDSPRRSEKVDDLTLLFIHMHHLINEFRPHQARETLRVLLEVQKRQRLETAERFQKHLENVQKLLQSCMSTLPDDAALDSKLLIKRQPLMEQDVGAEGSATQQGTGAEAAAESGSTVRESAQPQFLGAMSENVPAPLTNGYKVEVKQEPMSTDEDEWSHINALDSIMCDIVDSMN